MMLDLKLKIPPLLLTSIFGLVMLGISVSSLPLAIPVVSRITLSIAIFTIGITFLITGVISFRLANTTVNPMVPNDSTALVTSGVYKITRNPMYLGFLMILISWGVFLSSVYSLVLPVLFVFYMNSFQIQPEESILQDIFGSEFTEYQKQVRRWI
jgi:protein-S-isoprenylcysteine O-methyltransferase Ste14